MTPACGGPIRVGLAGYGLGGRVFHAPLIRRVPGLQLTAVMSRSEDKRRQAEQELGVRTFDHFSTLANSPETDLVVIVTPHDTHCALAVEALRAGKHVIVDKVMSLTVAEADRMIEAAENANRLLSVYQNRRWDGDFLTLRRVVDEGLLGRLRVVESCVGRWGLSRRTAWRLSDAHGGGYFRDWGAHLVDQALQIGGTPRRVFGDMLFTDPSVDIETYGYARIEFASGLRFCVETGCLNRAPKPRFWARGDLGSFVKYGLDPQEAALARGDCGWPGDDPAHRALLHVDVGGQPAEVLVETVPGGYVRYYENIAAVLHEGAALAVTAAQGREVVRVLEAARQSAHTGAWVRLDASPSGA
ncbi:MAG TPA: Gfo/Idh/MocA family oxidoreductase [Armatimonadota bacterium]|nr:Gfo/Idh/MocA family oxidoreductase [Armatimonadota bacterium]